MKTTIDFGKHAVCGTRKVNRVTVDIELRETDNGPVFSASGDIWNARHTDIVQGGQCLDSIAEIPAIRANRRFKAVLRLWRAHHLNDMHAGTEAQENALAAYKAENGLDRLDYDGECEVLKGMGLYEDNGYRYGSKWLYRPIPESDLAEIKALIDGTWKAE